MITDVKKHPSKTVKVQEEITFRVDGTFCSLTRSGLVIGGVGKISGDELRSIVKNYEAMED